MRASQSNLLTLAQLPFLISLPLAVLSSFVLSHSSVADYLSGSADPDFAILYSRCSILFVWLSLCELFSEPYYLLFTRSDLIAARVLVDCGAQLTRSMALFIGFSFFSSPLEPIVLGQMIYSLSLLFGYLLVYRRYRVVQHFPSLFPSLFSFDRSYANRLTSQFGEVWAILIQTAEKFILSEGEKFALLRLNLHSSGVWGLVSNLGSIAARLILQPIEEAAQAEFAIIENSKQARAVRQNILRQSLALILRLLSLLSLCFILFGPAFSPLLIRVVYGPLWHSTSAARLLAFYSAFYVPVIAFNGVTEAFTYALMNKSEIERANRAMIAFSLTFIAALIATRQFEAFGLLAASTASMLARIAFSTHFIRRYFGENFSALARSAAPNRGTAIAAAAIAIGRVVTLGLGQLMRQSEPGASLELPALAYDFASLLVFVLAVWRFEWGFFLEVKRTIQNKKAV